MNVMVALAIFLFFGLKVIYILCDAPAAIVAEVGLTRNKEDDDTMLVIDNVLVPPLLTVTESFFVAPAVTVPKLRLVGLTENSGLPALAVVKLHVSEYALVPALFDAHTCQ